MKKGSVLYGRRRASRSAALSLGTFSIALGLVEVLAPRALARVLGMRGSETWLRACGMREIATGIGILSTREAAPWMWGRVAGDAIDLATLGAGFAGRGKKGALTLAAASVAGVTMADIATAQVLSELRKKGKTRYRDYSDRAGIRRAAVSRAPLAETTRV
jgi:lambda repressor-like predicted transcriptional regulator